VIISVVGTRRRRVGLRHLRSTRHIVSCHYSPRRQQQHQYPSVVGRLDDESSGRVGGVGGDGDAIAGPAATVLRHTNGTRKITRAHTHTHTRTRTRTDKRSNMRAHTHTHADGRAHTRTHTHTQPRALRRSGGASYQ